jgi:tRNA nucleotidyltransferase (CCA-adding enzyme)
MHTAMNGSAPRTEAMVAKMASRGERYWEHFPHVADIGVRGVGPTREAAFEQAAIAMTATVCDPVRIAPREAIEVTCSAPDEELLFVEWLNALVYEMAARGMLFSRFAVRIDGDRLTGTAWGEPVDVARHKPAVEVKGATYTALRVYRRDDGQWTAECIVDV